MEIEIKAEGFKELMEQLDELATPRVQRKIVNNAVREGARVVKAEAEMKLGKGKGYIGIGTPRKKYWGADTVASIGIGILKKHWQVVFEEYGTRAHKVIAGQIIRKGRNITGIRKRRGGIWTGSEAKILADIETGQFFGKEVTIPAQPAKPFLRPALDAKKTEVLDRMRKYLELVLIALIEHKSKIIPEVPRVD